MFIPEWILWTVGLLIGIPLVGYGLYIMFFSLMLFYLWGKK